MNNYRHLVTTSGHELILQLTNETETEITATSVFKIQRQSSPETNQVMYYMLPLMTHSNETTEITINKSTLCTTALPEQALLVAYHDVIEANDYTFSTVDELVMLALEANSDLDELEDGYNNNVVSLDKNKLH
jgi:hypothetical protein